MPAGSLGSNLDWRPLFHLLEKLDDIRIAHPNAAVTLRRADIVLVVCAMDVFLFGKGGEIWRISPGKKPKKLKRVSRRDALLGDLLEDEVRALAAYLQCHRYLLLSLGDSFSFMCSNFRSAPSARCAADRLQRARREIRTPDMSPAF